MIDVASRAYGGAPRDRAAPASADLPSGRLEPAGTSATAFTQPTSGRTERTMWTHDPLHQLTCPRCTAVLARTDDACHRCGQAVALAADGARFVAVGAVCPRCSRPVR
ncbi:hypothetical protein DCC79_04105, partial [bacterium]